MAAGPRRGGTTPPKEILYRAVFEGMEGDHGQAPAGLQYALGRRKPAVELVELRVHVDAQGLEVRVAGSMPSFERGTAPLHDFRERGGGGDRRRLAGIDDGAGHAARMPFAAVAIDDIGQRRLRRAC